MVGVSKSGSECEWVGHYCYTLLLLSSHHCKLVVALDKTSATTLWSRFIAHTMHGMNMSRLCHEQYHDKGCHGNADGGK